MLVMVAQRFICQDPIISVDQVLEVFHLIQISRAWKYILMKD